jgi:hypothetical protein
VDLSTRASAAARRAGGHRRPRRPDRQLFMPTGATDPARRSGWWRCCATTRPAPSQPRASDHQAAVGRGGLPLPLRQVRPGHAAANIVLPASALSRGLDDRPGRWADEPVGKPGSGLRAQRLAVETLARSRRRSAPTSRPASTPASSTARLAWPECRRSAGEGRL